MDSLGAFDEIAELAAFNGGGRVGKRGAKFTTHQGIADNIMRAARHVERAKPERPEIKLAQPEPAPAPATIAAALPPVTSYSEALDVIRARLGDRLNISYENFDTLCTFPAGFTGKAFGPSQVKRFGLEKFFDAIRGAGLRIRFEEDPQQTAMILDRIADNFLPRQANQARPCNTSHPSSKMIDNVLQYLTRKKGGLSRLNTAVRETRSVIAQRGYATRRSKQSRPQDAAAATCARSGAN